MSRSHARALLNLEPCRNLIGSRPSPAASRGRWWLRDWCAPAADGALVEPDHVYVCPPGHLLTIEGGKLYLAARNADQLQKSIDVFLSALAEERGESVIGVIGVVLSGGGSDGALGIKAIKERGGLTLAQGTDGSGPRQSSMPETAPLRPASSTSRCRSTRWRVAWRSSLVPRIAGARTQRPPSK